MVVDRIKSCKFSVQHLFVGIGLLFLSISYCQTARAGVADIVIDYNAIKAQMANVAAQAAIEAERNTHNDSIKKAKALTAKYSSELLLMRQLYNYSMTNINGFGTESAIYLDMANTALDIITTIPKATKALNRSPLKNAACCYKLIMDIKVESISVFDQFVNIVCNGKLKNPFTEKRGKGDGFNYLDRYQRMDIALSLLSSLHQIDRKLWAIKWWSETSTWREAWHALDREGYWKFWDGVAECEWLCKRWRNFCRSF